MVSINPPRVCLNWTCSGFWHWGVLVSYQTLQCNFRTSAGWVAAVEMSVLFCIVKPQNWGNGVLMKEVACLCGCQAGMIFGRAVLFSFQDNPGSWVLPDQTEHCSHDERTLWVSLLLLLAWGRPNAQYLKFFITGSQFSLNMLPLKSMFQGIKLFKM